MNIDASDVLSSLFLVIGTIVTAYFGYKQIFVKNKADGVVALTAANIQLIEQYREENAELRERLKERDKIIEAQTGQIAKQGRKIAQLEAQLALRPH